MITPEQAKAFFTDEDTVAYNKAVDEIDCAIREQYETPQTEIKVNFKPPLRDRVLDKICGLITSSGWKLWRRARQGVSFAAINEPNSGGFSGCRD